MHYFINQLYTEMNEQLKQIAAASENTLQRAELSYQAVKHSLTQLKERVTVHTFKDKAEEIYFFKETKPIFLRELIFFMELYYIELNKPVGSTEEESSYFTNVLEAVKQFFVRNRLLYSYYQTGKTIYDELFFLRNNDTEAFPLQPEYSLDFDSKFSTVKSFLFSKIQACGLQQSLRIYPVRLQFPYSSYLPGDSAKTPYVAVVASLVL